MKKIFAFLVCWLMLSTMALQAQTDTVTIGTGTSQQNWPLPGFYGWTRDIMMYTSDEFERIGNITHIAYNLSSSSTGNREMKIYLMETTESVLTNGYIISWDNMKAQGTQVFHSTSVSFTSGWNYIELDNPYLYSGTSNLLVMIEGVGCSTSGGCTPYVYSHTTTGNLHWFLGQDSDAPHDYDMISSGGTFNTICTTQRANTRFVIDDVSTCPRVTNLAASNITLNNADLTWTAGGTETSWLISYKKSSVTTWSSEEPVSTTAYDFTANPLLANTQYNVRVRALCNAGDTSNYTTFSFRTACSIITLNDLPYEENFDNDGENAFPPCWSRPVIYSTFPKTVAAYSSSSPYSLKFQSDMETYAILPDFEAEVNDFFIEFDLRKEGASSGVIIVGVMTDRDDITSFIPIDTMNPSSNSVWTSYRVLLNTPEAAGKHIIAFKQKAIASNYYYWLDNVVVKQIPDCEVVNIDSVRIFNITSNSVDIFCNEPENTTNYDIRYREIGEENWITTSGVSIPYTIQGLDDNTIYEVQIYANCSIGAGIGEWTSSKTFKTTCLPIQTSDLPYQENFNNYGADAFPDCWSRPIVNSSFPQTVAAYDISLKFQSNYTTYAILPDFEGDVSDFYITFDLRREGINSGVMIVGVMTDRGDVTTFIPVDTIDQSRYSIMQNFRVDLDETQGAHTIAFKHQATASNWYYWLDNVYVNVLEDCKRVNAQSIAITDIMTSSTQISWEAPANSTHFDIRYREVDSTDWSTVTNVSSPYTLTGLSPLTRYEVQIYAHCNIGAGIGAWSNSSNSFWTATEIPMIENFDGLYTLGKGWNYFKNTTNGSITSTTSYFSSPRAIYLNNGTSTDTNKYYYVSPKIDPTASLNSLQVRLKARAASNNVNLSVGVVNSDDIHSFNLVEQIPLTQNWETYIISLSGYSGSDEHIALGHIGNASSSNIYLDDINIELIPACNEISRVSYSDTTHEGITVSWDNTDNGAPYTIRYITGTDTLYETGIMSNPYTLTSLLEYTEYKVAVSNSCEPDVWSRNHTFKTTLYPNTIPFTEDFEGTDHVFYFINGTQSNQWIVGSDTVAQTDGSTQSMYISNDTLNNAYTLASESKVYAIACLQFDEPGYYTIDFDWKGMGEVIGSSYYDYGRVGLTSTTATYSHTTDPSWTWLSENAYLINSNGWKHNHSEFLVSTAGVYHLAFYWRNDGSSGTPPPLAIDNISVERSACERLRSITGINPTLDGFSVKFEAYSTTTDVRFYYRPSSETNWIDSVDINLASLTDNTYDLTGLEHSTIYTFTARALCGDDYSATLTNRTCTTACGVNELPWSEDFTTSTFPPTFCWDRKSGIFNMSDVNHFDSLSSSTAWSQISTNSNPAARLNIYGVSRKDWLITPVFALDAGNNLKLSVDMKLSAGTSGTTAPSISDIADDKFMILFSLDGGETWDPANTIIWDCTGNEQFRYDSLNQNYKTFVFPLNQYSGDLRIAFYGESTVSGGDNYLFIDNLAVIGCTKPTDLVVNNLTGTTATVSWESEVEDAEYSYFLIASGGISSDTIESQTTSETTVQFSNLAVGGSYKFYVKTLCEADDHSTWASIDFVTPCESITTFPWTENFDNRTAFPTRCWDRKNDRYSPTGVNILDTTTTSGWNLKTLSGNPAARLNIYGTSAKYWMELPVMTLPAGNNLSLVFDAALSIYSYEAGPGSAPGTNVADDKFLVAISTDGGATYLPANTTIWDTTATSTYNYTDLNHEYTTYQIPLDSYSGDIRIAFYGESTVSGSDNDLFIDNIAVTSCVRPLDVSVSDITASSATINWTSAETSMTFEYVLSGSSTIPNDETPQSASGTSEDLNGLNPNTVYYFYVRSSCGGVEQSEWIRVSFRTECEALTRADIPHTENFDDYTATGVASYPYCWERVYSTTSANPYISSSYYASGNRSLYFYSSSATHAIAASPEFDLPMNELQVSFKARFSSLTAVLQVGVMTDPTDASTFELVETISPTATSTFENFTVLFGSYTGIGKYIAFKYESSNALYIDNVVFDFMPDCPQVGNLVAASVGSDFIELEWTENGSATSWEIEYDETGFVLGESTNPRSTVSTNPITISNLNPNTEYDLYVRPICSSDTAIWRMITVKTECGLLTLADLPYSESFDSYGTGENAYPDCWKKINTYSTTYNYPYINTTNSSAPGSLYLYGNNSTDVIAIVQPFDATVDIRLLKLEYKLYVSNLSAGVIVGVMSDPTDASTFTPLENVSCSSTSIFQNKATYLYDYTEDGKYIAFKYYGSANSVYIDNLVISQAPACEPVSDITSSFDSQNNNLTLSWDGNNGESQWEIVYSDQANFNPTTSTANATSVIVNTNTHTFTTLDEGVLYKFFIRAICGAGDTSIWSRNGVSVNTVCLSPTVLPYFEDFESYTGTNYNVAGEVPTCWAAYSDNVRNYPPHITRTGSSYHYPASGSKCLTFTSDANGHNTYAVLPEFTDPLNRLVLSFAYKYESSTIGTLFVGYVTDNTDMSTFVSLKQITGTTTITRDTIIMSDYTIPSNVTHIVFKWYNGNTSYEYTAGVDDISVTTSQVTEPCNTPTNLTVSAIQAQTATVSWTAGGTETEWIVEHKKQSDTDYGTVRVTQPSTTLSGLEANTSYDVRVKAVCGTNDESDYISKTFTTLEDGTYYTITPSVNGNGTISPDMPVSVREGESQLFTFSAATGSRIDKVLVNDVETDYNTSNNSYEFTNVQQDYTIKVVFVTGIEDHTLNNSVNIYPNPTHSILNVRTDSSFETVEITNMLGQVIYSTLLNDNNFQINVSGFDAGVYFIRLTGENGSAVKKFVKN